MLNVFFKLHLFLINCLKKLLNKIMQVLWNSKCLDSLLFAVHNELPSAQVHDPAWVASVRSLHQKVVREWITNAFSYAPCTTQGLLQVWSRNRIKSVNSILHRSSPHFYCWELFACFVLISWLTRKYEAAMKLKVEREVFSILYRFFLFKPLEMMSAYYYY